MHVTPPRTLKRDRKRSTIGRYQAIMACLFVSPAMILFAVFVLLPAVMALYEEFLEKPLGHKSHELLHTKYTPRGVNK